MLTVLLAVESLRYRNWVVLGDTWLVKLWGVLLPLDVAGYNTICQNLKMDILVRSVCTILYSGSVTNTLAWTDLPSISSIPVAKFSFRGF